MKNEIWFKKYEIIQVLGRGNFGQVFLGKHILLEGYRAIKRIAKDKSGVEQVIKEAKIIQELQHPLTPIIYDLLDDMNYYYIIMEYIQGSTLYDYKKQENKISLDLVIEIGIQLSNFLMFLRSQPIPLYYTDIKPQNIMIFQGSIKVIDYAGVYCEEELEKINGVYLTKKYAPLELYQGGTMDETSCVYNIGKILEFLIEPMNFIENRKLEKTLKDIIKKATLKNPWFRYSSILLILKKLNNLKDTSHTITNTIYPYTIGITSSLHRMGVTHLAFFLASYYKKIGVSCIYIEYNKSNHLHTMMAHRKKTSVQGHIFLYEQIPMIHYDNLPYIELSKYQVHIYDFGSSCYNYQNIDINLKFFLLGAKEWEKKEDDWVYENGKANNKTKYIFFMCSLKQYYNAIKEWKKEECYRLPIFYDPFCVENNTEAVKFIKDILL